MTKTVLTSLLTILTLSVIACGGGGGDSGTDVGSDPGGDNSSNNSLSFDGKRYALSKGLDLHGFAVGSKVQSAGERHL